MKAPGALRQNDIVEFIATLFDGDLHARRVLSLANGTLGILTSASLAVHAIGQGLAHAQGALSKHGVKQVDRLLSNQTDYEDALLCRLYDVLPAGVRATIVADRGFADCKLLKLLSEELGFDYVVRLRSQYHVTNAKGERRKAAKWVGAGGRARTLRDATLTDAHELPVATVVCVQAKDMKEPWCLVASDREAKALGYDRWLKANTVKRRTRSLFRQGLMLYEHIPNWPEERLRPLLEKFAELLHEQRVFRDAFGVI